MMKNNDIKRKLGIVFIILAIISPLFAFLVPFLELPKTWSIALVGFLIAGAPEIFLIIGGLLAGKEMVTQFKSHLKDILKNRIHTMLLLVFVYIVIMGVGMYLMHHIFGFSYGNPDMVIVLFWVEIILSGLAIFFAKNYFHWADIGFGHLEKKYLWWLLIPTIFIAMNTFFFIEGFTFSQFNWGLFILLLLTTALVGFSEELVFRGIVLHILTETYSIKKAILISALLFSLLHAVNILGGFPLTSVLIQLAITFIFGLLLATLALKLKNIIPLMIIHFLWDFALFAAHMV